jgi:ubiquinone/menaquinone biosynthesis C-methylase UbiE
MARIPETEVMNDPASVDGYTLATQSGGLANHFLPFLESNSAYLQIADIGCGNVGYASEIEKIYPNANFFGYDASELMLEKAKQFVSPNRYTLTQVTPSDIEIPSNTFDIVISSLLLHQYLDPSVMWDTIKRIGKPGSKFFVFDLLRVEDETICNDIVKNFSPEISTSEFQKDYFNTLRAAFTIEEIQQQLLDFELVATIENKELYPNCSVVYITGTL